MMDTSAPASGNSITSAPEFNIFQSNTLCSDSRNASTQSLPFASFPAPVSQHTSQESQNQQPSVQTASMFDLLLGRVQAETQQPQQNDFAAALVILAQSGLIGQKTQSTVSSPSPFGSFGGHTSLLQQFQVKIEGLKKFQAQRLGR